MTSPTHHGQTGESIAASLRGEILDGDFRPGERIRQDELARRYGASRHPVREALKVLEAEGLVNLVANAGAWVASLSLEECEELYRVRERVEPLLVQMNLPLLSDAQIERMRDLATAMERTTRVEDFLRLDREFHFTPIGAAETRMLQNLVTTLWNQTHHYRREFTRLIFEQADRTSHFEHYLLVNAIARRDAEEVGRVLSLHIRRTRKQLVNHPDIFAS